MRRHEISDEQWVKIKDLLPGKAGDPGRATEDNRLFINAMCWIARTGAPPVTECRDGVDVDSVRRGIKTRFLRFGESVHSLLRRSVFRDSRRSAFPLGPLALFDQLRETINLLRDPEVMVETLVSKVEFLK